MQQQRTYWLVPSQGRAESQVEPAVREGPRLMGQFVSPVPPQPTQLYWGGGVPRAQPFGEHVAPTAAQASPQLMNPFWCVMHGPQNGPH